jgi:hypothetical protein
VRLTATTVARANRPGIFSDDSIGGFHLRVAGKASKSFRQRLEIAGEERGWTIGRAIEVGPEIDAATARAIAEVIVTGDKTKRTITADSARLVARAIRDLRDEGKILSKSAVQIAPGDITLKGVRESYAVWQKSSNASPLTVDHYDDIFRLYFEALKYPGTDVSWADTPMRSISRPAVIALHADVTSLGKPVRANQILRVGSALYNHARKHLLTPGLAIESPFMGYHLANAVKPRHRGKGLAALAGWHAELDKLAPLRKTMREFFLLSVLRERTVHVLKWEHVHFNEMTIDILEPKGGEVRRFVLPMSQAMARCLRRAKEQGIKVHEQRANEWVFPSATSASGHIEESKEVSRWKRKDGGDQAQDDAIATCFARDVADDRWRY